MNRRNAPILVLLLAIVIVFGQTITHEFVRWDDLSLITQNPYVKTLDLQSLIGAWQQPHKHLYIPLTYNVWAILGAVGATQTPDASGSTLNPYVFHLANILVHAVAALSVYGILKLLLDRPWIAAAGAILWAIHPLQVEPVAWATGMKDVLSGSLALVGLYLYLRAAKRHGSGQLTAYTAGIYLAAALLVALGSFAKPGIIGLPISAIAIDALILRRPIPRSLFCAIPLLIAVIPTVIVTQFAQPAGGMELAPAWTRPLIAGHALATYLLKLVFPRTLGIDYGLSPGWVMKGFWVYVAWLIPAGVTAAVLYHPSRRRELLTSWLVFLAGVGPVLGLTPFVFQFYSTVADRYAYLSLLGVALAASWAMTRVPTRVAVVAGVVVLFAFGMRSIIQVHTWRDSQSLMTHTLSINPRSFMAHNVMASLLTEQADELLESLDQWDSSDSRAIARRRRAEQLLADAENHVRISLEIWPGYHKGWGNLAVFQIRRDDLLGALESLQKAVDAWDQFPQELTGRMVDRLTVAKSAMNLKRYQQAAKNIEKYLVDFPDDTEAHALLHEARARALETSTSAPSSTMSSTQPAGAP